MSQSDQELIRETLSGRTEAYGELVVRYQDRLFHSLTRVLRSRDDAQEVAQDAFLQAFQKLDGFRGDAAFYSWLFRIAMNVALSRMRRRSRQDVSLTAIEEQHGAELADADAADPRQTLDESEQRRIVLRALDALPDDYRTVLVLKEMEGLKYEEIAAVLGCPVGTVRSRIHRARGELQDRVRAVLGDGSS